MTEIWKHSRWTKLFFLFVNRVQILRWHVNGIAAVIILMTGTRMNVDRFLCFLAVHHCMESVHCQIHLTHCPACDSRLFSSVEHTDMTDRPILNGLTRVPSVLTLHIYTSSYCLNNNPTNFPSTCICIFGLNSFFRFNSPHVSFLKVGRCVRKATCMIWQPQACDEARHTYVDWSQYITWM